jgi:UPF0755 protein
VNDTVGQQSQQSQKRADHSEIAERGAAPGARAGAAEALQEGRSQVVIFLNFLMTIVVLAAPSPSSVFYYAISTYQNPGPLEANTNFIVRNGAGITEIAFNLERNNIISDGRVFRYLTERISTTAKA